MENSQTMHLATLVCMWAGVLPNHASRMLCLHVAREYSPTMHHVAGSAPPKIKKNIPYVHVTGEYSATLPSPFLFACGKGVCQTIPHAAKEHAPTARSVLVRQPAASTATPAKPALDLHHRRRHRWHHGQCQWTMMTCPRMTIAITCMLALRSGCHMVATVADCMVNCAAVSAWTWPVKNWSCVYAGVGFHQCCVKVKHLSSLRDLRKTTDAKFMIIKIEGDLECPPE